MAHRIEVSTHDDARAVVLQDRLNRAGFSVDGLDRVDAYTIDRELEPSQLEKVASQLSNPIIQDSKTDNGLSPSDFSWAIEVGFRPGVTDNIGTTVREMTEDALRSPYAKGESAHSSYVLFVSGELTLADAKAIGEAVANPLIERITVKSHEQYMKDGGMGAVVPKVTATVDPKADYVDLDVDDLELQRIGKMGVKDHDRELTEEEFIKSMGQYKDDPLRRGDYFQRARGYFKTERRGPLALDLQSMRVIRDHFKEKGRKPTDIEVESLAQTWSEHCKHTIFADPMDDDIPDGLYKHYIQRATQEVRQKMVAQGEEDICISVFTDNAGVVRFNDEFDVCYKVETHNSPSALDPFGGSITGIVGVNRDPMGTDKGGKCVINLAAPFCVGDPEVYEMLYKGAGSTQPMLSPGRMLQGIIDGVRVGGNCSGIPTSFFGNVYEKRYSGKPLVFVGTVGLIKRNPSVAPEHVKEAQAGDYIIMAGGRVGKDGIHGATFSSEAMDEGSPATAVQIGDPITQKKLHDAQLELADLGLYNSETDNGAGGLSCSVAEMAKETGGCRVILDDVPLKYSGMLPSETWISESQERMTYSVAPDKLDQFMAIMKKHGVEATVIGEFNDSGRCVVNYRGEDIMDIDMDFLHDGVPVRPMKTKYDKAEHEEPGIPLLDDLTDMLHDMLARKNIASHEYIVQQYDHEVKGGSVLKPLQGKGRVNGDATVTRVDLNSDKGVLVSQGINPTYSDIDTYHMAASAIDTAVRRAIAGGATFRNLALLDNFCWSSSNDPQRLGELKEACRACYDLSTAYETPFVSGKDSMFNDFRGYDNDGKPVHYAVPPTLLVTALSVMESNNAISIDAKFEGDSVYVLGETHDELGSSEYFAMVGEREEERGTAYTGNSVPKVDIEKNRRLYHAMEECIAEGVIASAKSVDIGGLGAALAKTAMAGKLGMDVSLENLPGTASRNDYALASQSNGRFVVTIAPNMDGKFKRIMEKHGVDSYANIGVTTSGDFRVRGLEGNEIIRTDVDTMLEHYRSTFEGY
ncbi:MAG: phosphoribosylformylglycinamidine synthase [Nanoarchaeota archaeon]|nr:phosphoribosylformylglycinamidine synthase [Nanoarchaeota archaeon]